MGWKHVGVWALALGACTRGPSTEFNAAAVRDSVATAMHEYMAAWKALDATRIETFFSTDSAFRLIDGPTAYTRAGGITLIASIATAYKSYDGGFNFDSLVVLPLSRTYAVAMVPYRETMADTAGATTTMSGSALLLWAREPSGWRILVQQTAPSPAAAAGGK